jgi:hypothetical protein
MSLLIMPLPIQMFEPLTHLMKVAEDLEYTELLDKVWPEGFLKSHYLSGHCS